MIEKMDPYLEAMPPVNTGLSTKLNLSALSEYYDDENSLSHDCSLLIDDDWKKFEVNFPELSSIDIFRDLGNIDPIQAATDPFTGEDECVFLNHHDCMWAGHCSSKEHAEDQRTSMGFVIPKPPVIKTEMQMIPTKYIPGAQQSLLKPSVKANAATSTFIPSTTSGPSNIIQHTPQTPPESDDEENKTNNPLLKILYEAINECDLNQDRELCDYFEGRDVDVKDEPLDIKEEPLDIKEECKSEDEAESEQDELSYQEFRMRTQMAAENDHSYHKDKNAAMRSSHYGLDTPSESEEEEEIDVVSVSNTSRIALSLPTNPSSTDQHNLQRRMATAMSRKHVSSGIKTLLPVRGTCGTSSSSGGSSPNQRGARGVKRGRGTRTNAGYKRRRINDGNREPSDKRHLHNDMERQRRVDLRIAFENLKSVVPEVSGSKKIAKVNILLQAAQYCYFLTNTNVNYTKQLEEQRKKQNWLRSRVSQLRKNLAARR